MKSIVEEVNEVGIKRLFTSPWHTCIHGLEMNNEGEFLKKADNAIKLNLVLFQILFKGSSNKLVNLLYEDLIPNSLTSNDKVMLISQEHLSSLNSISRLDQKVRAISAYIGIYQPHEHYAFQQCNQFFDEVLNDILVALKSKKMTERETYDLVIDSSIFLSLLARNVKDESIYKSIINQLYLKCSGIKDDFLAIRALAVLTDSLLARNDGVYPTSFNIEQMFEQNINRFKSSIIRLRLKQRDLVHDGNDFVFFALSLIFWSFRRSDISVYGKYALPLLSFYQKSFESLRPISKCSMYLFYLISKQSLNSLSKDLEIEREVFLDIQKEIDIKKMRVDDTSYLRATYLIQIADYLDVKEHLKDGINESLIDMVNRVAATNKGNALNDNQEKYGNDFVVLSYAILALGSDYKLKLSAAVIRAATRLSNQYQEYGPTGSWNLIYAILNNLTCTEGYVE